MDDFSQTLREGDTDRTPEGITTFNEFYEIHREGFKEWLDRWVKGGELSDRSNKAFLLVLRRPMELQARRSYSLTGDIGIWGLTTIILKTRMMVKASRSILTL